jgi:hypothetical protein
MRRNLIFLLICFAATGLIATGCGGGGDDAGGDGGTTQSKEEFLAQGNQICSEGNAALNASDGPADQSQESLDAFVADTLVPNIQGQIDDLRDLDPPDEGADEINSILDDAQADLDEIAADPSSVGDNSFSDVQSRFKDFGLTECASG